MGQIVVMNDDNIVEAISGFIFLSIITPILREHFKLNRYLVIGISFAITFYFRKVSVNIYNLIKRKYMIHIPSITLNI